MSHKHDIQHILKHAEALCQKRGVKLTPQRREVLQLMAAQKGCISAYDLLDKLKCIEPQAKPPTVYRALDFLKEQGFIHKIESTNSYVVCHHIKGECQASVLFICQKCGSVNEEHAPELETMLLTIAQYKAFIVQNSIIEIRGICSDCHLLSTYAS